MITNEQVLETIGGVPAVRDYLRGIEAGSEADRDAQRAILAAIASMRAAGVYPAMAEAEPELYAQAALLLCRLWTDAEDQQADAIGRQAAGIGLQLRYDPRNVSDEE